MLVCLWDVVTCQVRCFTLAACLPLHSCLWVFIQTHLWYVACCRLQKAEEERMRDAKDMTKDKKEKKDKKDKDKK